MNDIMNASMRIREINKSKIRRRIESIYFFIRNRGLKHG